MKLQRLLHAIKTDLAPSEGRLTNTLGLSATLVITVAIAMMIQVPEAGLSCYLLFFAWRDNAGEAIFNGVKLIIAGSGAVVIANPLLQFVVDDPMLRLGALAIFTILGMYLARATILGEMASTAGFIFAFMLTLYDVVPLPELLSVGLEWIWVVLILPMIVLILWAACFGTRSETLIKRQLERLRQNKDIPHTEDAQGLLDEGLAKLDNWFLFAKVMGGLNKKTAAPLAAEVDQAYFSLALAEAGVRDQKSTGASPAPPIRLFYKDAFTNPDYIFFALKVLAAVMICYSFYTGFNMFGIHTAMITCYFVALGTTGATRHKIMLRIIGCLLGAGAALLSMIFVVPHAVDIGWLIVMIIPPVLCASWLALGSERISYAGWQLGLCYFLVMLHSWTPPTSFSPGSDRIVGILVGCAAMYAIFSLIRPESATTEARNEIAKLYRLLATSAPPRSGRETATIREPLSRAIELQLDSFYEAVALPQSEIDAARAEYLAFIQRSFNVRQ